MFVQITIAIIIPIKFSIMWELIYYTKYTIKATRMARAMWIKKSSYPVLTYLL